MGAIDGQGVYIYDGTELGAPGATFQNLGQNAQSAAFADVRADIAGLQLLVDSSWVLVSLSAGWTAVGSGHTPRVRKVGNRVDIYGAATKGASGDPANILTIPVGFRLTNSTYGNVFLGSVATSGLVTRLLALNVVNHQIALGAGYGTSAAVATGEVIPLIGSWYVN